MMKHFFLNIISSIYAYIIFTRTNKLLSLLNFIFGLVIYFTIYLVMSLILPDVIEIVSCFFDIIWNYIHFGTPYSPEDVIKIKKPTAAEIEETIRCYESFKNKLTVTGRRPVFPEEELHRCFKFRLPKK